MADLIDLVCHIDTPHYRDHLGPIWQALPNNVRGKDHGNYAAPDWQERPLLLAGYPEVERMAGRKYIYVEHGAGQTYIGLQGAAHGSYSGGRGHRNCIGFICPNQDVANRWLNAYPNTPVCVAGAPSLDPWHRDHHRRGPNPGDKVIGITFHWNAMWTGVQETQSAFDHYHRRLPDVIAQWRNQGWTVLGHGHPRDWVKKFAPYWAELGVETVGHTELLDRANVLVADNTSVQAEFLSMGRSVIFLNCPAYRKDVDHGGRFWLWPEQGVSVDNALALAAVDLESLPLPTWHPYAYADGHASQRAASFISEIVTELQPSFHI